METVEKLEWTIRLADAEPDKFQKLKIIYALAAIAAIVIGFVTKGVLLPVVTLVVLVASTYEFVSGRKYVLNERVARSGVSEILWPDIRSVLVQNDEIHLSPFDKETKLDAFRGVKLKIQNVSRENVVGFIRNKVGEDVRILGE